MKKERISTLILLMLTGLCLSAQVRPLDRFETTKGWSFIKSDGVEVQLTSDQGLNGRAAKFEYNFTKGTGYGGIQKPFSVELPENYEFTFYVKAESPANNFEIKFLDNTGNNVWWVNNRNYTFPGEWKKIRIKKRHIQFAWGPTTDQQLRKVDRIEFTIASFVGGKGTIWIDDLSFEPLKPETDSYPTPFAKASTTAPGHEAGLVFDNNPTNYWSSSGTGKQMLTVDFTTRREFGGLQIRWQPGFHATDFSILLSDDGKKWEKSYEVKGNTSEESFIRMQEAESRYMKIELLRGLPGKTFGIREIDILKVSNSMTLNDFLIYTAKHSPPGDYPRYFLEQASYWTITGVNSDVSEAMINEDGMVEVDKARFSIEPVIRMKDSLFNWYHVRAEQRMSPQKNADRFMFAPTVTWPVDGLDFSTSVATMGEPNVDSKLLIRYSMENRSSMPVEFDLFLLIRPYQVNPYYQFLNLAGGVGKIHSIRQEGEKILVDDKTLCFTRPYEAFRAMSHDEGSLAASLRKNETAGARDIKDPQGLAQGMVKFSISLKPGESTEFFATVPFHPTEGAAQVCSQSDASDAFRKSMLYWAARTSHINFILPESGKKIIDTYRSNLVYILINRDKSGIQPGSRSYERSWIRDGALTSSALLKAGIVPEVKEFIEWYARHLYENGKVPCVVDFRGPDPVPENDSHGQFIYLIREYYNFTHDTSFLRSMNPYVLQAVKYIESLIAERSTDHFRLGNDSIRAYYGLVPESISHEGYSAKPMHSYWDDFFVLKGLKDAADIQHILGDQERYTQIVKVRDTFTRNLYNSLDLAMKLRKIDYIPGCVELGDFDATSTTVALTPCNELKNLPKPQVYNTFDKYYKFFKDRRDGKLDWVNYTPYENRLIGSFILLDQPDRAHELINYFLGDQRPQGWNHWAEVVWRDYRRPSYIGDMPHTWCGSDFLNAIRSMFVYENEYDQTLVVGAGLYQDWIDNPDGMMVANLPTYYGEIAYSVKKEGNSYRFNIFGVLNLPANGIRIKNFNGGKMPVKVTIDGAEIKNFTAGEIPVIKTPAEVLIQY